MQVITEFSVKTDANLTKLNESITVINESIASINATNFRLEQILQQLLSSERISNGEQPMS